MPDSSIDIWIESLNQLLNRVDRPNYFSDCHSIAVMVLNLVLFCLESGEGSLWELQAEDLPAACDTQGLTV